MACVIGRLKKCLFEPWRDEIRVTTYLFFFTLFQVTVVSWNVVRVAATRRQGWLDTEDEVKLCRPNEQWKLANAKTGPVTNYDQPHIEHMQYVT